LRKIWKLKVDCKKVQVEEFCFPINLLSELIDRLRESYSGTSPQESAIIEEFEQIYLILCDYKNLVKSSIKKRELTLELSHPFSRRAYLQVFKYIIPFNGLV
jgi:hypothetical protein